MAGDAHTSLFVSLKGEGSWRGIDRRTAFIEAGAGFHELDGCYVTKDGNQVRRLPGWGVIAEPTFSETFGIGVASESAAAGKITYTMTGNHGIAVGDAVYIDLSLLLTAGWYTVSGVPSATAFEILTSVTGSSAGGFQIFPSRLISPHSMVAHGKSLAIIGGDKYQIFSPALAVNHLAAWVTTTGLQFASPPDKFAYWGSPLRGSSYTDDKDFGDVLRRSVIETSAGRVIVANQGYGCILEADISNAELEAGARTLCVAGPPKGLLYFDNEFISSTVPFSTHNHGNIRKIEQSGLDVLITLDTNHGQTGNFDVTIIEVFGPDAALLNKFHEFPLNGIVVAANSFKLVNVNLTANDGNRWGFANPPAIVNPLTGGTYYVAVAYQYIHNGELGLISDFAKFNVSAAASSYIEIIYALPREVMRECPTACEVLIFAGTSQNDLRLIDRRVESALSGTGPSGSPVRVSIANPIPSTEMTSQRVPRLELSPMGAKVVKAIRGYVFYGGTYAYAGANDSHDVVKTESWPSDYDNADVNRKHKFLVMDADAGDNVNVGGPIIPAGYQGVPIHNPPRGDRNWSYLESLSGLQKATGGKFAHQWRLRIDSLAPQGTNATGHLILPKGHLWFSEREHPGVVPAINRLIADVLEGQDIEGLGRVGDLLIAATNKETYAISFGRSPLGTDPVLISDEFGCIAPRSMVEFDKGLFWLSERGPVISNGGAPVWVGEGIFDDEQGIGGRGFKTVNRHASGMMYNAFAQHDPTRGLIWVGVNAIESPGTWAARTDDEQTLQPADFFWIYSYHADAWTTWTPPSHLGGIYDMALVSLTSGEEKLAFLSGTGADAKVYAFDDEYYDGHKDATIPTGTVDVGASSANNFVTLTALPEGLIGMGYVITNAAKDKVKNFGTIPIAPTHTGSDSTFFVPGYTVIETGDEIILGRINMKLGTGSMSWGEHDREFRLAKLEVQHEITQDNTGKSRFMRANISDGFGAATELTKHTASKELGNALTESRTTIPGSTYRGRQASMNIWAYGDGIIKFEDIRMEIGPGG